MFSWRSDREAITMAMTDREGGVSAPPWDGFNLGSRVGDDPAAVAANRSRLAEALGLGPQRLVFLTQVHGAEVVEVDGPVQGEPAGDVLVTSASDLALCVLAADCVPVLAADKDAGVIGAAHAGRPGMVAGTVTALIEAVRERGGRRIEVVVGPAICGPCYEVPQAMHDDAVARVPAASARTAQDTTALDIRAGVLSQLAALRESRGLELTTHVLPACTREDSRLYSYRRDGTTGRHAGIVVRRAVA